MRDEPILSVDRLGVGFRTERGSTSVLEKISFEVRPREILSIVGESGSGKSITALAIMGLIDSPSAVIEGSVRYRGRELLGLDARAMRAIRGAEIAMIFQDPMTALTPVYTVGHQIEEQLYAHDAQDLARPDLEGHVLQHAGKATFGAEADAEAVDGEDRLIWHRVPWGRVRRRGRRRSRWRERRRSRRTSRSP